MLPGCRRGSGEHRLGGLADGAAGILGLEYDGVARLLEHLAHEAVLAAAEALLAPSR